MDPVTIVGLVEGSISFAVKCGSVAKSLNNLAGKYQYANLTISTMVQSLDIMQVAWDRIGAWSKTSPPMDDDDLTQRLKMFLQTGSLVLGALEEDLQSYDLSRMTLSQKSRIVWNENLLQGHQTRIRDQAQSMSLLLQAIQLPTPEGTKSLLQQSKKQFAKSDESALSMVPSRMSSRLSLSTGENSRRDSIDSNASMTYRRLSFEDDLFTAKVYKRNYHNTQSQRQRRKEPDRDDETIVPQSCGQQHNMEVPELILQPCSLGKTTTESIAYHEPRFEDDELFGAKVHKKTYRNIGSQLQHGKDPDLDLDVDTIIPRYCDGETTTVTSATGSHSYIERWEYLKNRITPVSTSYKNLVMACDRGDNESLMTQLAKMPVRTPGSLMVPTILGGYISGSFYFCPIHAAVFNGHVEVMLTLLRRAKLEDDIDRVVEKAIGGTEVDRWRPLHVATLKRNLPMIKLLVEYGASASSKTGYGVQPAHIAARTGSMDILAFLFSAHANPNCTDMNGRQPLHYITDSQDLPDVVEYLAKKGGHHDDIVQGLAPNLLCIACKNDFIGNLKALLSLGAGAGWYSACDLQSALGTAIRYGSPLSVQFLLEYGVIPTRRSPAGRFGLRTFFLRHGANLQYLGVADIRILRLLLERVDLLAWNHRESTTVLQSLFHLFDSKLQRNNFAKLLMENLPEHRIFELETLRSIMSREEARSMELAVEPLSSHASTPLGSVSYMTPKQTLLRKVEGTNQRS